MRIRSTKWAVCAAITAGLLACGGGNAPGPVQPLTSAGQVKPPAAAAKVNFYAASRFAEQATFGATPTLVAELQAKGFEKWIDEQMALPASQIATGPADDYSDPIPASVWNHVRVEFRRLALSAPDHLRVRVTWSLSQFIVAALGAGHPSGHLRWMNLLQEHALGNYAALLRNATISPHMGNYLSNSLNRPKSAECPGCAPNENYARELMQLFSIGLLVLNPDGTPATDSRGRLIESYTQRDVEELARVLTGWTFDPVPANRSVWNYGNWAKPMVPSTWPPARDSGQKLVLGKTFAAGQSAPKDLQDAIDLLVNHRNAAPFVALRLIQNIVKSNPSPAYVGRVATRFRDNGQGVVGDMKSVLKAVLLDAEARAGDDPSATLTNDGRLREPFLHRTALLRGLGCPGPIRRPNGELLFTDLNDLQEPFGAPSVFGFYAPTDRAPGSNLLAPEQGLLIAPELTARLSEFSHLRNLAAAVGMDAYSAAGCQHAGLVNAFVQSPRAYTDWIGQRYFRGAMPPTLRSNLEQRIRLGSWDAQQPDKGALQLLEYSLFTPYFGVLK